MVCLCPVSSNFLHQVGDVTATHYNTPLGPGLLSLPGSVGELSLGLVQLFTEGLVVLVGLAEFRLQALCLSGQ